MTIPVNESVISEESKKNVIEALNTNWLSSTGPFVKKFEENFAEHFKVQHAVTVTNGGASLHVALLVLGIGPGKDQGRAL